MRNTIKTSVKTGVAVVAISGLAMSGVALAQTTDDPATEPESDATTDELEGRRHGHHRRGGGRILGTLSEVTGLSVDDLVSQLQEQGATIASVAVAAGSSAQEVIDTVVAELEERLAEAVADERITQAEADEKLADATERVTDLVNEANPEFVERAADRIERRQAVAAVLGMTTDELRDAKEAGQSLSDLVEQQGADIDALVDVLVAPLQERLDDAVAEGDLTQAEADDKLADAEERITEGIQSGEGFGRGFGPGRGGPRGGFGPGGPGGPGGDDAENVETAIQS